MLNFVQSALGAASLSMLVAAAPAQAVVVNTFTGSWAPTAANGFDSFVQAPTTSTFTTSVSGDGLTLTALIANNGDMVHPSFFLQNYSYQTVPLLPTGPVSYRYEIQVFSDTGSVEMFDDFGNSGTYASGEIINGSVSINYTGGYFSYFGVNIDDLEGTASAIVTLTNLLAPVPEPGTIVLAALGIATLVVARRRQG